MSEPAARAARIRVAVVDDQPLVRMGLRTLINSEDDLELVGEAEDGRAGLELLRRVRPDVVLMDIRMPRMNGLEATEHIGSWAQPPRVIVLTTFDGDDYVARALGAGASGFLLKDTAPAAIIDAIRRVADGDPMLSPSVTARLIAQLTDQLTDQLSTGSGTARARAARDRLARLTEREHEVAVAVGEGLTNAEIAVRLHLSVPTVKAHIGRLFAKLEVANRVQIAICVHDAGLT
jgi:DNA-binding NarL/FixJ family response regulator